MVAVIDIHGANALFVDPEFESDGRTFLHRNHVVEVVCGLAADVNVAIGIDIKRRIGQWIGKEFVWNIRL